MGNHCGAVALQHIADCLRSEHIATAAVNVDRDLLHIAQSGQVVRKPLRSRGVFPPASLGDVTVKKKLRLLVITGQIAELPERLILCLGRLRRRLIDDSVLLRLSQCRPPPFSFSLR